MDDMVPVSRTWCMHAAEHLRQPIRHLKPDRMTCFKVPSSKHEEHIVLMLDGE